MRLLLLIIFTLAGILIVFYLSWLPQPKLGLNWFIPDWLATWTDAKENGAIRTGVPFIVLGVLSGIWLLIQGYSKYAWYAAWLGLIAVVIIAETGQLFLPYRSFDWWDVVWGATGAAFGLAISNVLATFKTQ